MKRGIVDDVQGNNIKSVSGDVIRGGRWEGGKKLKSTKYQMVRRRIWVMEGSDSSARTGP